MTILMITFVLVILMPMVTITPVFPKDENQAQPEEPHFLWILRNLIEDFKLPSQTRDPCHLLKKKNPISLPSYIYVTLFNRPVRSFVGHVFTPSSIAHPSISVKHVLDGRGNPSNAGWMDGLGP